MNSFQPSNSQHKTEGSFILILNNNFSINVLVFGYFLVFVCFFVSLFFVAVVFLLFSCFRFKILEWLRKRVAKKPFPMNEVQTTRIASILSLSQPGSFGAFVAF